MQYSEDTIYGIIASRLSGETLSESDAAMLDEWLDDAANREEYKELEALYRARHRVAMFDGVKTPDLNTIVHRKGKSLSRILRYAAAIAVLLASAAVFTLYRNSESTVADDLADYDVSPGSTRAVLVLNDGRKIELSGQGITVDNGVLAEDGQSSEIHYPDKNTNSEHHFLKVGYGGEYKITLSDGTAVWLNAGSELSYPTSFSDAERRVTLKGEAYFDVTRDEARPFVVGMASADIRVLGTEFNVSDYYDDDEVRTTLVSGKVEFVSGGNVHTMSPGQQCVYDKESGEVEMLDVDPTMYSSWKDGTMIFVDMQISQLAKQISRWYDINVVLEDPELNRICFTGAMERNKPVSHIVRLLNETNTVKCRLEKDKLIFSSL